MDSDNEDYDLEYADESEPENDIDLENHYFYGKTIKPHGMEDSLKCFHTVLILEDGIKTIWGFKALKQIIKINFSLGHFDEMILYYKQLFSYFNVVTRNYSEKSVNSILNYVSKSKDVTFLQELYEITLNALKQDKNERLWYKTTLKLGLLFLEKGDVKNVLCIIKDLRKACSASNEFDENRTRSQLLEVCALEIQLYTEQKQSKKLKALYEEILNIDAVTNNSDVIAVIKECGGKMYLQEENYEKAHKDFYEAFKNYYITANPRRIICIKYILLTNVLAESNINPFDSPEIRPFEDLPELVALKNLFLAYNGNDVRMFDKILQQNRANIMNDSFIRERVQELWDNIKVKMTLKVVKPYSKIRIAYIAGELNITSAETEQILVQCILNRKIFGKIDQMTQTLIIDQNHFDKAARNQALSRWRNYAGRSLIRAVTNLG